MHESLRASLFNHLVRFSAPSTPRVLSTQLALAVADLAIYMDSWTDVVASLFTNLSGA